MTDPIKIIRFILVGYMLLISTVNFAQEKSLPDPEGSFIAILVQDLKSSNAWYRDVLGFELIDLAEVPERGFKQSNLKRGTIDIELIELNSAISQQEALSGHPNATRVQGLFKVGFRISNFDGWLMRLKNKKVEFVGNVITNMESGKRMLIIKDPDGNRIQLFEK